jgi:phage head maturation protease
VSTRWTLPGHRGDGAQPGAKLITGHAAVFGKDAIIGGEFRERIEPGNSRRRSRATTRGHSSITTRIMCSPAWGPGTLNLSEDRVGLRYEIW